MSGNRIEVVSQQVAFTVAPVLDRQMIRDTSTFVTRTSSSVVVSTALNHSGVNSSTEYGSWSGRASV